MGRFARLVLVIAGALCFAAAAAAEGAAVKVYKTPTCGCCTKWVEHLEANGFRVQSVVLPDLSHLKQSNGISPRLASCHTAFVDGYVIEGHVPAQDIERLLEERPQVAGLTVPRMPIGSPGMEGPNPVRYDVLTFDVSGKTAVFATHGP